MLAALVASAMPAGADEPRAEQIPHLEDHQWREDLRVFAGELTRRHRNAFHAVSRERFQASVADLDRRIPALEDHEIVVEIQGLAAMVGDGHTFLGVDELYRRYPLELFWYGEDLRVIDAAPDLADAVGARVVAIGGHPIDEVKAKVNALVPQAENAWYRLDQNARQMVLAEPLAALGVASDTQAATFTFQDDAGRRFDRKVTAHAPQDRWRTRSDVVEAPLSRRHPDQAFWFTALPDASTVYLNFRRYEGIQAHAAALIALLKSSGARRLVIDLRQNRGGNYTLARQHLLYPLQMLPQINRPGGLYVLTGRATFSAAMTNTTDFRRETEAILVGEPPGARPNGYQELASFVLPNSRLRAFCAILHYRFQLGASDIVEPDRRIDPDWRARRLGRDETLDWVLAQPLQPAAADAPTVPRGHTD